MLDDTKISTQPDETYHSASYDKIISDEIRRYFEVVNYVFISGSIGLFGIFANIINILVFTKQGVTDSITVSLLGLAISDMCALVTLEWFTVLANPLLLRADIQFAPSEFQYLTAGWPHFCFTGITCWITLYITIERCMCITFPLKVKLFITPRMSGILVTLIFLVFFLSMIPMYYSNYYGWKFYPAYNKTLLGLLHRHNFQLFESVTLGLNVAFQITFFLSIIIVTGILVCELREKTKWRAMSASKSFQTTTREHKLGKMIILLSSILIVCYLPGTVFNIVKILVPEFTVSGNYENVFETVWSFAWIFQATNSSVNIFVYYNMSSKYRSTFRVVVFGVKASEPFDKISQS